MKLARKSTSYHVTPVGLHLGRCFGMIEIGSNESTFNGKTTVTPKAVAQFEILDWHDGYGNTPVINHIYTVSGHAKAKLRQDMEMLNGKPFTDDELDEMDTSWMLGRYCMLNIVHIDNNGYTNAKIAGVLPVPASISLADPVNSDRFFTVDTPDFHVFNELPGWLKRMIQQSSEWPDFRQVPGWEIHFDNPPEAVNDSPF